MTMLEHIQRLFSYDGWANREVFATLQTLDAPPVRSLNLLGHIASAERLWLERLLVQKQSLAVWPLVTLEQCKLEGVLTYKNTKGESFTSQKQDILLHVVTHSAYHRGQIAADMRAAGFAPAYTDFIHAVRQGFVD